MALELMHASVGGDLSRTEWESITAHTLVGGSAGSVLYYNGTHIKGLAPGTSGYVLSSTGTGLAWINPEGLPITTLENNLDAANFIISNLGASGTDFVAGGGLNLAGPLNMQNQIISNVGAAGTDFTGTGGLVLADGLSVSTGTIGVGGVALSNSAVNIYGTGLVGAANIFGLLIEDISGIGVSNAVYGAYINAPTGDGVNAAITVQIAPTTPPAIATTPGIQGATIIGASGSVGGNTTIATTGVGGAGGHFGLIAGAGGQATAATTSSTGGLGGAWVGTTGAGGAASVAGAGICIGGAGGAWVSTTGAGGAASTSTGAHTGGASGAYSLTTGTGGAATGGSTNTGGVSGAISLVTGTGGAGATIGGASGNITLRTGSPGAGGAPTVGSILLQTNGINTRLTIADAALTSTVPILYPSGTAGAPSIAFTANPTNGFYNSGGTTIYSSSGSPVLLLGGNRIVIIAANALNWAATSDPTAATDLALYRDAANTLAQQNGTNAQTFRVYNTFTNVTNYERATFGYVANSLDIGHENLGTGVTRNVRIKTNSVGSASVLFSTVGIDRWSVTGSGHFIAPTDNTYDIGATGATRPRSIYAGTSFIAPDGTIATPSITFASSLTMGFYWSSAAIIGVTIAGTARLFLGATQLYLRNDVYSITMGLVDDVVLTRDAADTLAHRRTTNPQAVHIYETYTDASNYSRLRLVAGSIHEIRSQAAGTGTLRGINLTDGNRQIGLDSTGSFMNAGGVAGILMTTAGDPTIKPAIATPAGGATTARLLFGTTAGFGIYYGSGAPTVSAAQGSLYLRSNGSGIADRAYINTNGTTGWAAIATAS